MKLIQNLYACALCQESYSGPSTLVKHVQANHDSSNGKITMKTTTTKGESVAE